MACNFVTGYAIDCRDSAGGIKNLYIAQWSDVSSVTESSGVVTAISMNGGKKFWEYQMEKENCSVTEKENSSVENGTTFYEQEVKFTIKKLTAAQRNNMRIMVQNRLMVIVKDANDNMWLLGRNFGLDKTGDNTASTGKAFGDLNGFSITLMGKDNQPMYSSTQAIASITV